MSLFGLGVQDSGSMSGGRGGVRGFSDSAPDLMDDDSSADPLLNWVVEPDIISDPRRTGLLPEKNPGQPPPNTWPSQEPALSNGSYTDPLANLSVARRTPSLAGSRRLSYANAGAGYQGGFVTRGRGAFSHQVPLAATDQAGQAPSRLSRIGFHPSLGTIPAGGAPSFDDTQEYMQNALNVITSMPSQLAYANFIDMGRGRLQNSNEFQTSMQGIALIREMDDFRRTMKRRVQEEVERKFAAEGRYNENWHLLPGMSTYTQQEFDDAVNEIYQRMFAERFGVRDG